jgi:hypothetical protein
VLISAISVCLSRQSLTFVGTAKYEASEHVSDLLFLCAVSKSLNVDVIDAVVTGEGRYRGIEGREEAKCEDQRERRATVRELRFKKQYLICYKCPKAFSASRKLLTMRNTFVSVP